MARAYTETAHMLNAPARAATVHEIRDYITTFDGHHRQLLGIFRKDDSALIDIPRELHRLGENASSWPTF
jgi:hypothetical protein